jgi:glycyl-tRNA synthetase beta chain
MNNLLVEMLVEELPPKALESLGDAFGRTLTRSLMDQGLATDASGSTVYASPRRLAVHIRQCG